MIKFKKLLSIYLFTLCAFICIAATPIELFQQGKTLQEKEDWYGAIEIYKEVMNLNPVFGEVYINLAQCSYNLGEYKLTLDYLDSANKFFADKPEILDLRGFALIGLQKITDAEKVFLDVLKIYPNDIEAQFGLAQLNILNGNISGAEKQYLKAFKKGTQNRKTLLSLALVSNTLGKQEAAEIYINQAIKYHSGNAEVHYFAAYLAEARGDLKAAEKYIRTAIRLNNEYDEAYKLLSDILYNQKLYEEVIEICTYRINRNRNNPSAYYLKGLAQDALGQSENAIKSFSNGLSVSPNDEIMRSAMETLIFSNTTIEDPRRAEWATWHVKQASEYLKKFYSVQAREEYKLALSINPFDNDTRLSYAELLLSDGYPEAFLTQLEFIQKNGEKKLQITDTVESYTSLLRNSLPKKWGVDPFYLVKKRWTGGVYYSITEPELLHPDGTKITTAVFSKLLEADGFIEIAYNKEPSTYKDAFIGARRNKQDYFFLMSFIENETELTINSNCYSGRTGNLVTSQSIYRTGNGRFNSALFKLRQMILTDLPVYGKIISRTGTDILIDLGKKDGIVVDSEFTVLERDKLQTADKGSGLTYNKENILGTIKIVTVGEEVSQGVLTLNGFYDRVNKENLVVPMKVESDQSSILEESKPVEKQQSLLMKLIRSIR